MIIKLNIENHEMSILNLNQDQQASLLAALDDGSNKLDSIRKLRDDIDALFIKAYPKLIPKVNDIRNDLGQDPVNP